MKRNSIILSLIPAIAFVCIEAVLVIACGISTTLLAQAILSAILLAACIWSIASAAKKNELVLGLPIATAGCIGFALQTVVNIATTAIGASALLPACVISVLLLGATAIALVSATFAASHSKKVEGECEVSTATEMEGEK